MPDNAIYYQLAYAATILIYGAYGLSIWWRGRRLGEAEREDGERGTGNGARGTGVA